MLHRIRRWLSPHLGIDLGTANTIVAVEGEGIVVDEPSVVALKKGSREILGKGTAVGRLAKAMLGRTPESITAVKPLRNGVITDFELCESMLRYFLHKARRDRGSRSRPTAVIAVPGGITPVERRAVLNSAERAGAGRIYLIEESRAAAIGCGLPLSEPLASMVCDIGGGTTETAIFSMGEIVSQESSRVAGDAMDAAIVEHFRRRYSLKVGLPTAERIKLDVGCAYPLNQELTTEVRGLDTASGIPRKSMVTSDEVRQALEAPLHSILETVTQTIERTSPELAGDLSETGIVLSGGGAQLRGLDLLMQEQLGIPVRVANDPRTIVAKGTVICLEHLDEWKSRLDHDR
jgi:rod shape-determining protein MreB